MKIEDVGSCPKPGTKGNNYFDVQDVSDTSKFDVPELEVSKSEQRYYPGDRPQNTDDTAGQNTETKHNDVHISNAVPLANNVNGGVGVVLGLFVPIILVMTLVLWVFYAYRNPHTKSGQLLIQVS